MARDWYKKLPEEEKYKSREYEYRNMSEEKKDIPEYVKQTDKIFLIKQTTK